jgi:DNA-binding NarL/FixJ family response regulator
MNSSFSSEPPVAAATRVLLVDDHPVTRQGMRAVIARRAEFVVCAEAESTAEALRWVETLRPDIALVDIALKKENGIDLTRALKRAAPAMPVVIVSMLEETAYAERALRAGAHGYLMKLESAEQLVNALEQALRGEVFVSPRAREAMANRLLPKRKAVETFPIDTLSEREWQTFALLGEGYSTREIAARMGVSSKTVDSYREHIKVKLGLNTGADLVRHAIEWGRTKEHGGRSRADAPAA